MREQTLAGILGVAGPPQPLGWITNTQPLAMVPIMNDRPAVAAQPRFPITVVVRSDFVSASVIRLPPGGTGAPIPTNLLFYLGRALMIAPSGGPVNPVTDPVALVAGPEQ